MKKTPSNLRDFASLIQVFQQILDPTEGCEWFLAQDHKSLLQYAREEVDEMAEAIVKNDKQNLREEIGDLLLQVMVHSEIARKNGDFDIADVIQTLNEKMIRRHPHIFSNVKVSGEAEIISNWQKIKDQEKAGKPKTNPIEKLRAHSSFDKAMKIGEFSASVGFDWSKAEDVIEKVKEELTETIEAIESGNRSEIESELGDLFFCVVQLARHLKIDPDLALRTCNQKFESRYVKMLELASAQGQELSSLSLEEQENFWQLAKKKTLKPK